MVAVRAVLQEIPVTRVSSVCRRVAAPVEEVGVALGTAARSVVDASKAVTHAGRVVTRTAWNGARALSSPTMLAGLAAEGAWLTAHLATYPFGLFADESRADRYGYGVEHLPPVQRGLLVSDVEAAGTPILLIHGLIDNRSIFTVLRRGLARRGFSNISAMNYSPLVGDVRAVAEHLAEQVERIVAETGYERIHIVGHSLGGLIARYYVTRLGGDLRVHTLVTLGTPHAGTYVAYGWPSLLVRQLRPGSDIMAELAQPAPGCRTRFIAYWSDLDQLVFPHESAAIDHPDLDARNIRLHGVGHVSLPVVGSVAHGISTALAQLDTAGHTVTPGVTPIGMPTR